MHYMQVSDKRKSSTRLVRLLWHPGALTIIATATVRKRLDGLKGVTDQGIDVSRQRYQVMPRVLISITQKDDVLLLKGAPTKQTWPNLYTGVGGHVERDESVLDAARREI